MKDTTEFNQILRRLEKEEWAKPDLKQRREEARLEVMNYDHNAQRELSDDFRYWYAQLGHILVQNYQFSLRQAAELIGSITYDSLRRYMNLYPLQVYKSAEDLMADLKQKDG